MALKDRLKDAWKKGVHKANTSWALGNPYASAEIIVELAKALKKPKNEAKTAP